MIRAKGISKNFGGVHALKNIDLEFMPGEIHGLVGENGAGKSTMMKILAGVYPPSSGSIFLDDVPVQFRDPKHARDSGIRIVYQELSLIPDLTVSENLYLHRFSSGGFRPVRRRSLITEAMSLLKQWGLDLSPGDRVESLPMGKRQLVEIAREVAKEGRLLILDEPTSSLTNREIEYLFDVLARLKRGRMSIVFISHRLDEVLRIADRVTVFRNGSKVETVPRKELSPGRIVSLIVGREIKNLYPKVEVPFGEVILSVKNLSGKGFQDISFDLRRGEILGIAGLIGAGRSEVLRTLFGLNPMYGGTVLLEGKPVSNASPYKAIGNGFGLLSESRTDEGIFPELSVAQNLIVMSQKKVSTGTWLRKERIMKQVGNLCDLLQIVTYDPHRQLLNYLSGGNQQKVVLGRLLGAEPRILLLDEPTRGVDVGTKAEIHRLTGQFVARGNGVIMVSSDVPEIVGICDRIMVLYQGRQVGMFKRNECSEEAILQCAMGLRQ